jgi:MAP7 domain-containing protein 1
MTRLDQLAKPHRKNGEHIFAILERERKQAEDLEQMSKMSLSQGSSPSNQDKRKSRSMSQLNGRAKGSSRDSSRTSSQNRFVSSLHRKNAETTKSMTQLSGGNSIEKKSPATKSGWTFFHKQKSFSLLINIGIQE